MPGIQHGRGASRAKSAAWWRIGCALALGAACVSHFRDGFSPSAPPAPPEEQLPFEARAGQVWVEGHWLLREGGWIWIQGQYVEAVVGKVFRQGFWERRDDGYHWVPGAWLSERMDHLWVRGHWRRIDGQLVWARGYWLPTRRGQVWIPGRWVRTAPRDRWVDGYWAERPRPRLPAPTNETQPEQEAALPELPDDATAEP